MSKLPKTVIAGLVVILAGCQPSNPLAPLGPDEGFRVIAPNHGSTSVIAWEFWLGSPSCISGSCLEPPARLLAAGGTGEFDVTTVAGVAHEFQLNIQFPAVSGHSVNVVVSNEVFNQPLINREFTSSSRGSAFTTGVGSRTPDTPGTSLITITVEDRPSGAPAGRLEQQAILRVTTHP